MTKDFNADDFVGKTFKSEEKLATFGMQFGFQTTKEWKVKEKKDEGGPFSGSTEWIIEQDEETYKVEEKNGRKLLQREEVNEVEK